jgi:hypothetical protein
MKEQMIPRLEKLKDSIDEFSMLDPAKQDIASLTATYRQHKNFILRYQNDFFREVALENLKIVLVILTKLTGSTSVQVTGCGRS